MNCEKLWKTVLADLEIQISRPNFLTWLKNSQLIQDKKGELIVVLPNYFAKEWVETKYHKLILGALRQHENSITHVSYAVDGSALKKEQVPAKAVSLREEQLSFPEMKVDAKSGLNSRYNLKTFVVGPSNELAYTASMAIIENIGKKYNPLFIYGGTGLGKTHLIQALGNEIKIRYKNKIDVKYVSSEKFTNDIISAIRNKRAEDVKQAYRNVDVLIVDDIQFIGGKEKTEEEFFHTFNALQENNKQIIISSDRPPRAVPILEERLRSRFEGGMITDITQPDYETRVAILKVKLQENNENIPEKIIHLIAQKVQRNIRELEGALNKIVFYKNRKGDLFTPDQAEKIINEIASQSAISVNPNQIIKAVASFYEISPSELIGRGRKKEIVEPRQVTIYLLRETLNMSYPYIAEKIGKRDHTTAIYAYEKISKAVEKDHNFQQKILMIKDALNKV